MPLERSHAAYASRPPSVSPPPTAQVRAKSMCRPKRPWRADACSIKYQASSMYTVHGIQYEVEALSSGRSYFILYTWTAGLGEQTLILHTLYLDCRPWRADAHTLYFILYTWTAGLGEWTLTLYTLYFILGLQALASGRLQSKASSMKYSAYCNWYKLQSSHSCADAYSTTAAHWLT